MEDFDEITLGESINRIYLLEDKNKKLRNLVYNYQNISNTGYVNQIRKIKTFQMQLKIVAKLKNVSAIFYFFTKC